MTRVAILQSSYIPWKGYIDLINSVDEFILYDDVAFSKNSFRNRNTIKVKGGTAWLTIAVRTAGRFGAPIRELEIADSRWPTKHWRSLQTWYSKAPAFAQLAPRVEALYQEAATERLLSNVNELFLRAICRWLGIATKITRSEQYELVGDRVERLIGLCQQCGADTYVSGPAATAYLDPERFARDGIAVAWMSYSGYREYRQCFAPPFVHQVSILDLLLNEGIDESKSFLLSTAPPPTAQSDRDTAPCWSRS